MIVQMSFLLELILLFFLTVECFFTADMFIFLRCFWIVFNPLTFLTWKLFLILISLYSWTVGCMIYHLFLIHHLSSVFELLTVTKQIYNPSEPQRTWPPTSLDLSTPTTNLNSIVRVSGMQKGTVRSFSSTFLRCLVSFSLKMSVQLLPSALSIILNQELQTTPNNLQHKLYPNDH